jgi:hypothetical protein
VTCLAESVIPRPKTRLGVTARKRLGCVWGFTLAVGLDSGRRANSSRCKLVTDIEAGCSGREAARRQRLAADRPQVWRRRSIAPCDLRARIVARAMI